MSREGRKPKNYALMKWYPLELCPKDEWVIFYNDIRNTVEWGVYDGNIYSNPDLGYMPIIGVKYWMPFPLDPYLDDENHHMEDSKEGPYYANANIKG